MVKIKPENHTFVICAYKESPYLEECIRSLKNQSVRTNLRMATSTDNGHIRALAEKYGIQRPAGDRERDTSIADYVWLPFRFEGDRPYLDWHDEWRIEDYE